MFITVVEQFKVKEILLIDELRQCCFAVIIFIIEVTTFEQIMVQLKLLVEVRQTRETLHLHLLIRLVALVQQADFTIFNVQHSLFDYFKLLLTAQVRVIDSFQWYLIQLHFNFGFTISIFLLVSHYSFLLKHLPDFIFHLHYCLTVRMVIDVTLFVQHFIFKLHHLLIDCSIVIITFILNLLYFHSPPVKFVFIEFDFMYLLVQKLIGSVIILVIIQY